MTRLAGIGSLTPPAAGIRLPASGAIPAFDLPDVPRAPSTVAKRADGLVGLSGLLALQEAETVPEVREREARRRGRAVLDALASLQGTLLGPGDPDAAAADLEAAVVTMSESADPALRAILGALRLRAMVELARLRG